MMSSMFHFGLKSKIKRIFAWILVINLALTATSCLGQARTQTPVEMHGMLHIENGSLLDEHGECVQLRGMSVCDLISCYEFVTDDVADTLINEWGCSVIRLPVTVHSLDNGYAYFPDRYYDELCTYTDVLIEHGCYVIIDWFNNHDGDTRTYQNEAIDFFTRISEKYGDNPNIIYEINNEPHGDDVTWSGVVKPYAQTVIDAIRTNDPDNIIIVDAADTSMDLTSLISDPIEGDNLMYSFHFYAGTNGQELRDEVQTALDSKLPLFCTQWATSYIDKTGGVFEENTVEWIDFLNANNISWCNWSIGSIHVESSNALMLYSNRFSIEQKLAGHWPDEMLSESGLLVRSLIRNEQDLPS